MKKAVKVLLGIGAVGVSAAGTLLAIRHHNIRKTGSDFVEDEDFDEDEADDIGDLGLDLDEGSESDDLYSEEELKDIFDDSDYSDEEAFRSLEEVAENPLFGKEKKLRPGEKKFIEEFVGGMGATSTILGDNIRNIDLLARTSNISCRHKCELIKELCDKAMDDSDLIIRASDEVLKLLHREYSDEFYGFLSDELREAVLRKEAAIRKEEKSDD